MASNVSYMSANRYSCTGVLLLLLLLSLLLLRARLLLVLLRAQSPFSSAAFRQPRWVCGTRQGRTAPAHPPWPRPADAAKRVHTRTEANLDACVYVCMCGPRHDGHDHSPRRVQGRAAHTIAGLLRRATAE